MSDPKKIPAYERDLVFFDIETSALEPERGEILEIAAVRVAPDFWNIRNNLEYLKSGRPEISLDLRVLPEHIETAEPEALALNGYDPKLWEETGVSLKYAMVQLTTLCEKRITWVKEIGVTLVAHNPCFDWKFVRLALARFGLTPERDYHIIDTASMAWAMMMAGVRQGGDAGHRSPGERHPGERLASVGLNPLCTYFGIPNDGEHRARADVLRMIEVYKRLLEREREEG